MILFFALCFVGVAIAGLTAFLIFWPLTLVHVRDRHQALALEFGPGAFLRPVALGWLLSGRYRPGDASAGGTVGDLRRTGQRRSVMAGCGGDGMNGMHDSWRLASLGRTLIWARLRVRAAGTAEILAGC
jgi:hypothetical protein